MIRHYLALAWQQLEKYRLQSLVSIVSLAIGFACFALASMWIKYETTYDAFHKDAEKLHVIVKKRLTHISTQINLQTLRNLPQFEKLTNVSQTYCDSINQSSVDAIGWLMNDSNLVSMLGIDIMEGTTSFVHNEHEVAVSDRLAKKIWGDESPIGKTLHTPYQGKFNLTRRVAAVFRYWGDHSNYSGIDILSRMHPDMPGSLSLQNIVMAHISPKVDMDALNAHLDTMSITRTFRDLNGKIIESTFSHNQLKAVPITKLRQTTDKYEKYARAKINHIYLFAIGGGMLIFCGLLNYLTMFINRLFIRRREIALRTVFGASGRDLMTQFLIEYGLLLFFALLLGLFLMKVAMPWFLTIAELPKTETFFYGESLTFLSLVFITSILISLPVIWYFRRQSLQNSITGVDGILHYNIFRRISTGIQIGTSIFCIFCTIVLLKQLDTLRHGDIGFERENRMIYTINDAVEGIDKEIVSFLCQCPEVDTAFICMQPLYPTVFGTRTTLRPKDIPELTEATELHTQYISDALVDFYGLTLLEGRWLHEGEKESMLVNETFVRRMGWKNPLEKEIWGIKIVGVVKDFQNVSPTIKAECYQLRHETIFNKTHYDRQSILVHHKPGQKKALMTKIEAFFKEKELFYAPYQWRDLMEDYEYMLESEKNLQTLLSITTGVCILIALFGVWSMIMLTCEQRRKEIAVRKVFGATTKDILDMFFVEYMTLQGVAALVAFPIGYSCMRPWTENYVIQASIPWWIYASIFMTVALLVALCIGWRVWKTATAHPADEICKG